MITITIEPADNGLVKFLIDDNINGGGEEHVTRRVYEFEGSNKRKNQDRFINDLILDLGLDTGTDLDSDKLIFKLEWGNQYMPTQSELKNKVKILEKTIKKYNSLIE